jgi:hypothetical protein
LAVIGLRSPLLLNILSSLVVAVVAKIIFRSVALVAVAQEGIELKLICF